MTGTSSEHGVEEVLDQVRLLAARVDKAISDALKSLRTRDLKLARAVVDGGKEINAQRYAIEEAVVDLISLQAPVDSDLRELLSILSMVTDLEHMGDHAEGVGRIALFLRDDSTAADEPDLWKMADIVQTMLRQALSAFLNRDTELAYRTCDLDDEVDALYDVVHRRLIQRLAGLPPDAPEFDAVTHVLWCSNNLERIGDCSTNICERAIFLVTGKLEEINVSRY